jgi:hypothetical protein
MNSLPSGLTKPFAQDPPAGIAYVARSEQTGERIYVCDPEAHSITVLDQDHCPLFAFGGFGSRPGQFDTPTDIAVVGCSSDDEGALLFDSAMLAVADCGNHRLQLFELDGAPIAVIGGESAVAARPSSARAGWPFFRLEPAQPIPFPSRLEWRPPYLDVVCLGPLSVRIDLLASLLPDFSVWITDAPVVVVEQAFRQFAPGSGAARIPDWCLSEIVGRLQPFPCAAAGSSRAVRT